jgi:catechol 2,3-dioxygenase-like lactoylglutathione lyase family enzyme
MLAREGYRCAKASGTSIALRLSIKQMLDRLHRLIHHLLDNCAWHVAPEVAVMNQAVSGFHHLGIIAKDLTLAVAAYERLGFSFTPTTYPEFPLFPGGAPQRVGVANRHAVFRNSYLEVLCVVDPAKWESVTPAQRGAFDIDKPLRRYEGLHVMHFGTENIEAVRERLLQEGLHPSPVQPFQRQVATDHGPAMMRARRIAFAPEANPEALFQIAQHDTPELVLQARHMVHPNGAGELTEAILCVEDPAAVALRYARYAGRPVERQGHLHRLDLGGSALTIVDPDTLGSIVPDAAIPTLPYFAGFIVSADLARVAALLNERGVAALAQGRRLIVGAEYGCGCAVVFEPPRRVEPGTDS